MGARLGVGAAVFFALSCSDRPVPEEGAGDGMSGEPCLVDSDCVEGAVCFGEVCVQQGLFRVSLSWSAFSDFDLHVRTPSGSEISFQFPNNDDGYLDVDDCVLGECSDDGLHIENINFNSQALSGTYEVWVQNFDGVNGGDFNLEVAGAVQQSWTGSLPATELAISQIYTFDYDGG